MIETPYDNEREDERTRARNRRGGKDERARASERQRTTRERDDSLTRGERNRVQNPRRRFETVSALRGALARTSHRYREHRTFEDESALTISHVARTAELARQTQACPGDGEAFPVLADSRARKHAPRFVGERANATMDPETSG